MSVRFPSQRLFLCITDLIIFVIVVTLLGTCNLMYLIIMIPEIINNFPPLSRHLIVVGGFACPNDPRSYVIGGFMPLGRGGSAPLP